MESFDRRDHWEKIYDTKEDNELSWSQENPETSMTLIGRAGLVPNAAVVDIGAGKSRLVKFLLAAGYGNLTVLDVAGTALARMRDRLGSAATSVKWVEADITRWQPSGAFDLWHDRAVFHFLTKAEDRKAYCACLEEGLKPGGTAIIGTFALDGPSRCSGLPVVRYSPETLAAELGNDFKLLDSIEEEHRTPAGIIQKFQFSRFRYLRRGS